MDKKAPMKSTSSKTKQSTKSMAAGSKPRLSKTAGISKTYKKKRDDTTNIFGCDLPSHRLRFPQTGNITAAEQIVFLTESGLRSHDALNRLIQNGLDIQTLVFKINNSRRFPKYPLKNNSMGTTIRGVMREHGHTNWTIGKHQAGRFKDTKWAPNNLSLAGLQLHCEQFPLKRGNVKGPIDNVMFEALAIDVTRFPEGDDALDLTRCVAWAVNNPGSGLLYPRDLQWLTAQLGGPQLVQRANQDRAAFSRWREADTAQRTAERRTRSKVKKADKFSKTLKSQEKRDHQAAVLVVAQAELDALVEPLAAVATATSDAITINADNLPLSLPGPTLRDVSLYLASFGTPQPLAANPQLPETQASPSLSLATATSSNDDRWSRSSTVFYDNPTLGQDSIGGSEDFKFEDWIDY